MTLLTEPIATLRELRTENSELRTKAKIFYIVASEVLSSKFSVLSSERLRAFQAIETLLRERRDVRILVVLEDGFARRARAGDVAEVAECETLAIVGLGDRVAARIVANDRVARLDGLVVLSLLQVRLADVELCVVGPIRSRESLDVPVETVDGEIVLSGRVVGEGRFLHLLGRCTNSRRRRRSRRRRTSRGACDCRIDGVGRRGWRPLQRAAECLDFLRQRSDADVVVVEALADDARVIGQRVQDQFLIREPFRQ